ncbi:Si-specific NAD(P)(+) transhydrogenase [soil metagenome]
MSDRNDEYDLVVIGSGPAGEKAAAQAAYFGRRVALVEKSKILGGRAVGNAGIPTKTLRETALYITGFQRRDVYGLGLSLAPDCAIDHLRARTSEVVATMEERVRRNVQRHGIELVRGKARLGDARSVTVAGQDGERRLRADRIIIATGSRPFHPPGIDFGDPDIHDSESLLAVREPFGSLVVLGGGPVGCEYASIFTALGVDVTLVDRAPRLVGFLDHEVSGGLADIFEGMGMTLMLGQGLADVGRAGGRLTVTLPDGRDLHPDKTLVASGRGGDNEGLGLEDAGVALDARGRVMVDERFQTTVDGVYAAGDVIGPPALASVSMEQGRVAACYACNIPFKETVDPLAPFGVYSVPEAAMAGLTEQAAQERQIDYEVGMGLLAANSRARIAGAEEGFVKLVFAREDRALLGVHLLGENATELVHIGQAVIHLGGTIDYFIHSTFNVPTYSEAFKYAAYDGLQRLARSGRNSSPRGPRGP